MNYIATVRYTATAENGLSKTITEQYLIQRAANFADAEEQATICATDNAGENIDVAAIKRTNICDIIKCKDEDRYNDTRWYKAKLTLIILDEKTGKERRAAVNHLVCATNIAAARNLVEDHMKGSCTDYEIATLDETRIVSVLRTNAAD